MRSRKHQRSPTHTYPTATALAGVFGAEAINFGISQPYDVRAKWINEVKVLVLTVKDYRELLERFPDQVASNVFFFVYTPCDIFAPHKAA